MGQPVQITGKNLPTNWVISQPPRNAIYRICAVVSFRPIVEHRHRKSAHGAETSDEVIVSPKNNRALDELHRQTGEQPFKSLEL